MLMEQTITPRDGQANNTAADRAGREKAFQYYRFLGVIQLLLGVALLVGGYLGTKYAGESFGPPFYIGGFIVGSLMLLSALVAFCIVSKGFDEGNEIRRNEVKGCVSCHHVTATFVFMGSLPGLMFAAMNFECAFRNDDCPPERDQIRYALIGGMVVAILTGIFAMYIVCTYGKYFGIIVTSGRRRMIVTLDDHHMAGGPMYSSALGSAQTSPRLQQLARENELLQQQLELQRQASQQQPLNTGIGYPPPPPPPAAYGYSTGPPLSSFPPFAEPKVAPPAYSSIWGHK